MKKKDKKKEIIDPGKIVAGQYVSDLASSHGKIVAGQYVSFIPINPNIILS